MKGMLAMAQVQFIKHLRDREDCSVKEIADTLHIHWRTAKKYADRLDWNAGELHRKKHYPVMSNFIDIVDAWLLEDQTHPRKQRHTAKRIYDRLTQEHGFTGSDRTVRNYVSKRKKELKLEDAITYVKLEHPGGEAQVDFGTIRAIVGGKQQELKLLLVSMPYSNAAFPYVLPAENTECFLEGLKRIFERLGSVPTKLWLDNLSAAVVSVESEGNRTLTDSFARFALHYRFEATFCNPGKGNEKGHVENKVGYARRNWCVPIPVAENLEELQTLLEQQAEMDLDRPHYVKQEWMRKLWQQEHPKLLKLPTVPYDVVRLNPVKVNKYGEVKLDGQAVPVARVKPGDTVLLKIRWNEVEVIDATHNKITTLPRSYMNKAIPLDWKHYLQMFRAKPRSLPYAAIFKQLSTNVQSWILQVQGDGRRSRVSWLLRMLDIYPMDEIVRVLESPIEDTTQLEHRLYRLRHPEMSYPPVEESHTPAVLVGLEPELSRYDQLHRKVVRLNEARTKASL
jgi:transposase